MMDKSRPASFYPPPFERGNCGIGFVADQYGRASHAMLKLGLEALLNLQHRGALDADARTGDGAGVLTALPRALFAREAERLTGRAVDPACLGVGVFFLPPEAGRAAQCIRLAEAAFGENGVRLLGWREAPIAPQVLGARARATLPTILHALLANPQPPITDPALQSFENRLFLARKQFERAAGPLGVYVPSLSARTIVYKGLLLAPQLPAFYLDLQDPEYQTPLVVFHQRYSTNTLPTWQRAQPFRALCHNGEINTLQGNLAWMKAREPLLRAAFAAEALRPVVDPEGSDSAMLDNVAELLLLGGRELRHALAMLVPAAWERLPDLPADARDFYAYHACLTEPWDGPAALAFTDGVTVGARLDRNGLRPCRYLVTDDGLIAAASEAGAVPAPEARVVVKGSLGLGQMLVVDTRRGLFIENDENMRELAARRPYGLWVRQGVRGLEAEQEGRGAGEQGGRGAGHSPLTSNPQSLTASQAAFGYTGEELTVVLKPMVEGGAEAVGSMGDDTPPAVLSDKPRPLFGYFRQRFAEVTNPPIDPLREDLVMSLRMRLGARGNFLDETPEQACLLELDGPLLTAAELAALRADADLRAVTLSTLYPAAQAEAGLERALARLCRAAEEAVRGGAQTLVLSDRGVDAGHIFIPCLLALGAAHNHLLRAGLRTLVDFVIESGEPREVHHFAVLIGYSAAAIHPYLALQTAASIGAGLAPRAAARNYIHAVEHGLLKIMSKMGISTLDAYQGAQLFESIGLGREVVETCFAGTPAHLAGIGLPEIARIVLRWHAAAFGGVRAALPSPGFYKFKRSGELHAFSPAIVHALHKAVKSPGALSAFADNGRFLSDTLIRAPGPSATGQPPRAAGPSAGVDRREPPFPNAPGALDGGWEAGYAAYQEYSRLDQMRAPVDLHDLLEFVNHQLPIPLASVEPRSSILRRFSTSAMSHGSLSAEAHETLAVAMNRLGAMSNSGEGGEHPARYAGDRNDRIKQVASARFGVTPAYLASAGELQIKMAQGSKPGEGGQLPGRKVTAEIALIRHATPGVTLISPPPHHDIYSIEDLAQLIFDLRQVNPRAAVSVKLVAQAGVGAIAAGVAKAGADVIVISGNSGGTGASPLSSIKYAGVPWELGLAEAQRVLVANGLRGRVRVRVDGGLRTGRDVVIAALLGADEFAFGTAAVVAEGCLMARACHLDTCPAGIATQRPDLRARFDAAPEQLMAFFTYMAEEVRETLAGLGLPSLRAATGRVDLLRQASRERAAEEYLDLSALLQAPQGGRPRRYEAEPNRVPSASPLDERLLADSASLLSAANCPSPAAASRFEPVSLTYAITNHDRAFGARLAGEIALRLGDAGLPEGAVQVTLRGSAGQSFGAFALPGMELTLCGEANDYVGKGLAGGRLVVFPPSALQVVDPVLAGNAVLYGATAGELYLAGRAGVRFAVRNSGATAVVEGVGDHGCEYMTGGLVVALGPVGHNFAAGMTGGAAYVLDEDGRARARINKQLVRVAELDLADLHEVRERVLCHAQLTGSRRAHDLLRDWLRRSVSFLKIVPKDRPARVEKVGEAPLQAAAPEAASVAA